MKKMMVFESIDGAGKTTLSQKMAEDLKWFWTHEPTFSSEKADLLNLGSKDEINREIEFAVDRIEHLQYLRTKIENNVVCDRYVWTGLAYCKRYNPKAFDFVKDFYLHPYFQKPDWYVFVDTPVEICLDRIKSRGDEKQTLENLKSIRQCFLDVEPLISKGTKIIRIESIGKFEDLIEAIKKFM
jgi:thymidylate kinase